MKRTLHRLPPVVLVMMVPFLPLAAQQPTEEAPPQTQDTQTQDTQTREPAPTEEDQLDFLDGQGPAEGDAPTLSAEAEDLDFIQGLLEEGEESLDTGFVYDAGGRRDPFRSLLRTADTVERSTGPRPEGVPGLLIDEITVTGVWMFPEGPVAQVQSSDNPMSFLLRPGTRVFDGEVTSISFDPDTGGEVVFRQIVRDPTSPKPFRDVVRRVEQ